MVKAFYSDTLNSPNVQVDYGCYGNHEFDFSLKGLNKALYDDDGKMRQAMLSKYGIELEPTTTTWISTNINGSDGKKPIANCKKSVLVDWHGVMVGIISVSENWLGGCPKLKTSEAVWLNDVEEATKACKDLRKRGAEVILALTHSVIDSDRKFMSAMPPELLDLCCGGHDHEYIRDVGLRIVKAGEEWRYLADIEFELPPRGQKGPAKLVKCDKVPINKSITPDPKISDLIKKWDGYVHEKTKKIIGKTPFDLDSSEATVRFKEGILTNWICDVIASDYSADEGAQKADFAMIMGYTIAGKTVTPRGNITYGELLLWFPTNETVVVLKLLGQEVVKSLEKGCASLPNECGSLHHVSHQVKYSIDLSATKGSRVKDVTVNGKPINLQKMYTVAVSSAMAQGRYGFEWMAAAPRVVDEEFATPFIHLLRDWFKVHKTISVNTDGKGKRIKIS